MPDSTARISVTTAAEDLSAPRADGGKRGALSVVGGKKGRRTPPYVALLVVLVVSAALLALYGWGVGSATLFLVEMLVGLAAGSVGGFLGFLFGLPRAPTPVEDDAANRSADGALPARPETAATLRYRPSTNLEQVSDWLTKILIGAGLVQLGSMSAGLGALGSVVAGGSAPPLPWASVVAQVVIVVFFVVGFLAGFLWTRIDYGEIQARADRDIVDVYAVVRSVVQPKLDQMSEDLSTQATLATQAAEAARELEGRVSTQEATVDRADTVAKLLAKGELTTPGRPTASSAAAARPSGGGGLVSPEWPEDVRDNVAQLVSAKPDWDSDPIAELFPNSPAEAKGRKLHGVIVADLGDVLVISLRVERTGGDPLKGDVAFLLHPTFPDPVIVERAQKDAAETKISTGGWFTVGAILDRGTTVLTYDLRSVPGAPLWLMEED
jgi:hypothetical protein